MIELLHLGWIDGGKDDGSKLEIDPETMLDSCLIVGAMGSGKTTLVRRLIEDHLRLNCPVLALDTTGDLTAWLQQDLGLPVSLDLPTSAQESRLRLTNADIDDFAQLFELPQIAALPRLVSALLGILQYKPRPGTPEHALIEAVVHQSWESGVGVPLTRLAEMVAHPPFQTMGRFNIDQAVPPDRRALLASSILSLIDTVLAWNGTLARAPSLPDLLTAAGQAGATILSFGQHSQRTRQFIVEVLLAMIEHAHPQMVLILDEAAAFLPPGEITTEASKLLIELLRGGIDFSQVGLVLVSAEPDDLNHDAVDLCETWIAGHMPAAGSRRQVVDALDLVKPPVDEKALDRALASFSFGQHVLRSFRLDSLVSFRTAQRTG